MSHIKVSEMPSKNAKIPTTTYPKKPLLAKILAVSCIGVCSNPAKFKLHTSADMTTIKAMPND